MKRVLVLGLVIGLTACGTTTRPNRLSTPQRTLTQSTRNPHSVPTSSSTQSSPGQVSPPLQSGPSGPVQSPLVVSYQNHDFAVTLNIVRAVDVGTQIGVVSSIDQIGVKTFPVGTKLFSIQDVPVNAEIAVQINTNTYLKALDMGWFPEPVPKPPLIIPYQQNTYIPVLKLADANNIGSQIGIISVSDQQSLQGSHTFPVGTKIFAVNGVPTNQVIAVKINKGTYLEADRFGQTQNP